VDDGPNRKKIKLHIRISPHSLDGALLHSIGINLGGKPLCMSKTQETTIKKIANCVIILRCDMKKKYMETTKNNSYAEFGTETVNPKQEQNSRFYYPIRLGPNREGD